MTRRTIVFIHSGHGVDATVAKQIGDSFRHLGFNFVQANLGAEGFTDWFCGLLENGLDDVLFFLSLNYYGVRLQINSQPLHQATGIPMVFYLADHPVYFLPNQGPELEGTITFVAGPDLVDFVMRHYPPGTVAINNQDFTPPPFEASATSIDDFRSRENVILCPMNLSIWGRSMDGVWSLVKELPKARQAFTGKLIEAALTDWETPLHVIAERLATEAESGAFIVSDTRLALDFVKIWRRDRIVRSLIDLPILVSSEYVPADLQVRYPKKFTLLTMEQTLPLYRKYRFVLNAFPLMSEAVHDRMINAIWGNAALITDRNRYIADRLHDEVEVVFYDYDRSDMAAKIGRYIEDPEAAFTLTERAALARRAGVFATHDSYLELTRAVERAWASRPVP